MEKNSTKRREIWESYLQAAESDLKIEEEILPEISYEDVKDPEKPCCMDLIYEDGSSVTTDDVYKNLNDLKMDLYAGFFIDYLDGSTPFEKIPVHVKAYNA